MVPGAKSKFGAPVFEPDVFRKQMYCIEESSCEIVATFRVPIVIQRLTQWISALELFPPCLPSYVPDHTWIVLINSYINPLLH